MKKILSLIIFVIILFSVTSCTKTKTELFENGRVKSQIQYRFGKEDGISRFFNPVYGTKMLEVHMKKGKKEGEMLRFYFNGNQEYHAFYKNDQLNGKERNWNLSGQLLSETNYLNGKKEGSYFSWHENGVQFAKGAFKNDLQEGKWEIYDERGLLIGEATFKQGSGVQNSYDKNGILNRKTTFKNGLKDGPEIHYSSDGTVIKTVLFKNDRIIEVNGKSINN
jgi:uncharacterized protein